MEPVSETNGIGPELEDSLLLHIGLHPVGATAEGWRLSQNRHVRYIADAKQSTWLSRWEGSGRPDQVPAGHTRVERAHSR